MHFSLMTTKILSEIRKKVLKNWDGFWSEMCPKKLNLKNGLFSGGQKWPQPANKKLKTDISEITSVYPGYIPVRFWPLAPRGK